MDWSGFDWILHVSSIADCDSVQDLYPVVNCGFPSAEISTFHETGLAVGLVRWVFVCIITHFKIMVLVWSMTAFLMASASLEKDVGSRPTC